MDIDRADFELVVIGAGVNGAAVARVAALRGLRVALVEAVDFAAGTSAASSRMVHGGIRYLEHFEFRLVRESLKERERLLHTAPHLVAPYPLLIPFYGHNRRPALMLRLGMWLYDALSFDKTTPSHERLNLGRIQDRYPQLEQRGLTGGAVYFDAQVTYAERLAVEQAIDAAALGAVIFTHAAVEAIAKDGAGYLLTVVDQIDGTSRALRTRSIVNAAGPWVDSVLESAGTPHRRLIGGTKGSHIVVSSFPSVPATGVHYEAKSDGRAILVLPQSDDTVVIGATDIFVDEPSAFCTAEEIDYLLAEVNHLIPEAKLTVADILYVYSGVRPLPYSPGAKSEAHVSRDHSIARSDTLPGVFSLIGGKLTTHRALGELAVDHVCDHLAATVPQQRGRYRRARRKGRLSLGTSLPGGRTIDYDRFRTTFLAASPFDPRVSARLLSLYGTRADAIAALARDDEALRALIPGTDDVVVAELVLAFRAEHARTLTDVIARRTMLARRPDLAIPIAAEIAKLCAPIAGWDDTRRAAEVDAYLASAARLSGSAAKTEQSPRRSEEM